MQKNALLVLLAWISLLAGCNQNLVGQNNNSLLAPTTPTYAGGVPNPWYIFDDNFNTASWVKGLQYYAANNTMYPKATIDFASTDSPYRGTKCIKFSYPTIISGEWMEGLLIHTPDFNTYASTPGVDLTIGGFTVCKFVAKASYGRQFSFGAQSGSTGYVNVGTSYQQYQIALPVNQTAVKDFFTFTFNDATTTAFSLYIDDVRYER